MTTNLAFQSANRLAARIREGSLSPITVVDTFLDRIEEIDGEVNAYTTIRADAARQEAREAAQAVEEGESLGPLHGVPVAVKDLIYVRGTRTTFGSPMYKEFVSEDDDIVVQRLREAGAIVLGKTNMPEFGRKTVTDSSISGRTNNPWELSRTVGGSSGGSAAAVAAGLAPLALRTDAAGSIRIPASACGVFGLLPDVGRVPAGSIPIGFASDGLPVGLQVIAPRRSNKEAIRACAAIENVVQRDNLSTKSYTRTMNWNKPATLEKVYHERAT